MISEPWRAMNDDSTILLVSKWVVQPPGWKNGTDSQIGRTTNSGRANCKRKIIYPVKNGILVTWYLKPMDLRDLKVVKWIEN